MLSLFIALLIRAFRAALITGFLSIDESRSTMGASDDIADARAATLFERDVCEAFAFVERVDDI